MLCITHLLLALQSGFLGGASTPFELICGRVSAGGDRFCVSNQEYGESGLNTAAFIAMQIRPVQTPIGFAPSFSSGFTVGWRRSHPVPRSRSLITAGYVCFLNLPFAGQGSKINAHHRPTRASEPEATRPSRLERKIGMSPESQRQKRGRVPDLISCLAGLLVLPGGRAQLQIEQLMIEEKKINANVDFYSASAYYVMGIPIDLYPLIFAVSRISGWTAHVLEQYAANKLIRPLAEYIGPTNQKYVPIDQR
jgi:Citrate synthase, C-terminal domain